jgi:hypothetical protein
MIASIRWILIKKGQLREVEELYTILLEKSFNDYDKAFYYFETALEIR